MFRIVVLTVLAALGTSAVAEPPPEAFGALPNIHDAAISPDGKQIAAIVNSEGTYGVRVLTVGAKNEKLRAVALDDGVKPRWVRWVNDDRVLISLWQSRLVRGTPLNTTFIYTLDTKKMKGEILIRSGEFLRQDNSDVIDFLDDQPNHILMGFSDEHQLVSDIQRVNVKTGKYQRLKRGRMDIQNWYTDRRGEPRVGQGRSDSQNEKDAWTLIIRDADKGTWRGADQFPGLAPNVRIFGFTSDPNELVIGSRADKQTLGLYVYDLERKEISRTLFHNDEYDARGLVVNGDGDIIGAIYVADTPEVEMLGSYKTAMQRLRQRFSDYSIDFIDQADAGDQILFKASNAYSPGVLGLFDPNTDDVDFLAQYRPGLDSSELGVVSEVTYTARDGFVVPAYITVPPTVTDMSEFTSMPFVVLPHGGPYARTSKRFDYFAQFFASRGFGVLQMNYRGSSGYGKAFEDAGRDNWALMLDDIEDGTRWLIDNDLADPDRVCIVGWSYGGYAALMGAIQSPELYACAVSMAGVTDLKDMINDIKQYRFGAMAAHNFILRGLDTKDDLRRYSPVSRAQEFSVPLFLAHGKHDQRVHYDQYLRMKSALKTAPAEVTYMEFDREDHFLSNQENRQRFFVGLDAFLRSNVDTAPAAEAP